MDPIAPFVRIVSAVGCLHGAHPGAADPSACAYQVAWSINPHMRIGAVDHAAARAQHARLSATLRRLGTEVRALPFVHGALDCVFAKDNAVLVSDGASARALLGRPRHPERAAEQSARAASLAAHGFVVERAGDLPLEGGDVVALPIGGALVGCGPRTCAEACRGLARFLDTEVFALPLRDPALYHLDTAVAVLHDGTALVCREAFEVSALETFGSLIDRGLLRRIITVPYAEALSFATNVVEVGGAIVTGTSTAEAPVTNSALRALGRWVIELPLDQFRLAGGSAACLVATVLDERKLRRTSWIDSAA